VKTAGPDHIPEHVLDAAIHWSTRLGSGLATDQDHDDCRAWRHQDPLHELAWQRLQAVEAEFGALAHDQAPGARQALRRAQGRRSRRRKLGGLALVLLLAPLAGIVGHLLAPKADLSTGVGERHVVTLQDGASLHLNTATRVDLTSGADGQTINLLEGEILVQSAAGQNARHRVLTSQGRIEPLGTRFLVRRQQEQTLVHVLEGEVAVTPSAHSSKRQTAGRGQTLAISEGQVAAARLTLTVPDGWTEGVLVARRMRLADVLAELQRYRRGWLDWDPAVADLRVSGVFQLDNTDRALAALERSLPVRLRSFAGLWVRVSPDPD